jgi:hypothetical protein
MSELEWAAGFFDGEGCTCVLRRRNRVDKVRIQLSITQADPFVLERFTQAVSIGTIYGPRANPGRKDMWRYVVSGKRQVAFVIRQLWPYLSPIKKAQAKKAFGEATQ